MEILVNDDCLEAMQDIPDNYIDLTVTSPPYDNLRTYNGSLVWNDKIWKQAIKELYRVTKKGGVVVWVVGDATIEGSETGTSFKQALYFKYVGFNLHDTMIYEKKSCNFPDTVRYYQAFEYMFILSKNKPKTFNQIKDRKNKSVGRKITGTDRNRDGTTQVKSGLGNTIKKYGARYNCWIISDGYRQNKHPATFPLKLAEDHIISWSNENDIVLDPFMGIGTTGIGAKRLDRHFIGIEKNKKYFEIAKDRINEI